MTNIDKYGLNKELLVTLKDIYALKKVRTLKNILLTLLVAAVLLPIGAAVLLQIPAVQTFTARKAASVLSKRINGDLSIGSVYIVPFNTVILKDVTLRGPEGDTIADVRRLNARLNGKSLFSPNELKVNHVTLEGGQANIRYITPEETNLGRIIAQLSGEKKEKSETKLPWQRITVDKVNVSGVDFSLVNPFAEKKAEGGTAMDFNDLHVKNLSLKATNLSYAGLNDIAAEIRNISFEEEGSGFKLDNVSLKAKLDDKGLDIKGLKYDDGNSALDADLRVEFSSFDELTSATGNLPVKLRLNRAVLDANTAKAFVNGLDDMNLKLYLSGELSGTVDNLYTNNLKVESETGQTAINVRGRVRGLPDIRSAEADLLIPGMVTNTADLGRILNSVNRRIKPESISKYLPGETIALDGAVNGRLADFTAQLGLRTPNYGALDADVRCKGVDSKIPMVAGNVEGRSLAVGKFLKDTTFGNLTFRGPVTAELGKTIKAATDNLQIDEFGYRGYRYSGITASAAMEGEKLTAHITDEDPNLTATVKAEAVLGKKNGTFVNADIDLVRADLHALNFDKRDTCVISGKITAEGELTPGKQVLGSAIISGLTAQVNGGTQKIGNLYLDSFNDDLYNITLRSNLANASYRGSSSVSELISGIKAYLSKEMGNIIPPDASTKAAERRGTGGAFYLRTGNLKPLAAFLMPDLHISEGTTVTAELEGTEAISVKASSPLVAFGSNYIKGFSMEASGNGGPIDASITAGILQSGSIILRNNKIGITADDNRVILGMNFDNKEEEKRKGSFNAVLEFPEQTEDSYTLIANLLNSDLSLEESNWNIAPSRISYRKNKIAVENFRLSSGDQQYLIADGVVSDSPDSKVNVRLNEFDISIINKLLDLPLEVAGLVTGKAEGPGVLGSAPELTGDLGCNNLAINGEDLGDLVLRADWDDASQQLNILADNTLSNRHPLKAVGFYKPAKKYLSMNAAIDSLAVSWLDPMLEGIAKDAGGSVSGNISAEGRLDKLEIVSDGTRFNDFAATIDFTNVPYVINGPFTVSSKGVTFQNDSIADRYGHVGRIAGGVTYDLFKDIRLNVTIDRLRDMHVLNTDAASASSGMYGKAFGSGRITLTGPISNIRLGLNLRTGDGAIHFPISSSGSTRTSILTFVDNSVPILDEYDSLLISKKAVVEEKKTSSNLKVNAKLNITNATEVGIDINRSFGDMLKAHGNGNVEVNFTKDLLDIKGGYNVEEGSYKFALMGITSKDFIIEPGGTVSFNGDIMQSDLDLTATYRTKASIGTLIADSTSVNTRRTVNCGIKISGKLSNPQIGFDIDIPDLDPSTQALVQAALSTEEKQLKQFLALLLSGSFVPDEQSGVVNNTTLLFSNASEIMANQINTIFRQLDIPLDLGFNYQPGLGGVDIFDVAISTQLFNNRVTINGSIGNQNYLTSYNSSDIVGNVDMEIKLNKNGMLRLNIFSHAADRFSNYLDQTQRNGAGIVYQQDFDTFKEFIRRLLRRKDLPDMPQPPSTVPPPLSVQ